MSLFQPHKPESSLQADVTRTAAAVLEINRLEVAYRGRTFTIHQPAPKEYNGMQWLWDSCFSAIATAHLDPGIAASEVRSLLVHQIAEGEDRGMIPHMRFWDENIRIPEFHRQDRSWLTNPPLIASTALIVASQLPHNEAEQLLKDVYTPLGIYHRWFTRRRDLEGDGLVVNLHPWETGRDAASAWDKALPRSKSPGPVLESLFSRRSEEDIEDFLARLLKERQVVTPEFQYKNEIHRDRFFLNETVRQAECDASLLRQSGSFCVQAIDYNSIRAADLQALFEIGCVLGDPSAGEWKAEAEKVRHSIRTKLWDTQSQVFRDRQLRSDGSGEFLGDQASASSFVAFFGGVPDDAQSEQLLNRFLNPAHFKRPYPFPSESAQSSQYDPEAYWRGNAWPSVVYLVWEGLRSHSGNVTDESLSQKMTETAKEVATGFASMVMREGAWEHYNPETGQGQGQKDQSWAAIALDMITRADWPADKLR